ncbi:MAG TPA: single-stranded DNA-binding protein [Gemmataceae bacterium]|nr:single-stranded DNA-binding protein [Gemmataceae bacterium]
MANLNKVMFIGRLTRDPESRTFANGGKVTKFGFAVTNRRKNSQTGQWEDEPMFIDCEAYNRGDTGKLADTVEQYCRKGGQIFVEGKLHLDQWDDKTTGQKRSKHKLVVEVMQLLDGKPQGGQDGGDEDGGGYQRSGPPARSAPAGGRSGGGSYPPPRNNDDDRSGGGSAEEIPF